MYTLKVNSIFLIFSKFQSQTKMKNTGKQPELAAFCLWFIALKFYCSNNIETIQSLQSVNYLHDIVSFQLMLNFEKINKKMFKDASVNVLYNQCKYMCYRTGPTGQCYIPFAKRWAFHLQPSSGIKWWETKCVKQEHSNYNFTSFIDND